MKKIYTILGVSLALVIILNIVLYFKNYSDSIKFQKSLLDKQLIACDSIIKKDSENFFNDINLLLYSGDVIDIFQNGNMKENGMRKLELFYSSYSDLVNNINVYDNNKNVLNLFNNQKNQFIHDFFIAQRQRKLSDKEYIKISDNYFQYCIPVFNPKLKENKVYGNVVVTLDLDNYIGAVLNNFYLKNIIWYWVIDLKNNNIIINYNSDDFAISKIEEIQNNLLLNKRDFIKHKIRFGDKSYTVITTYYATKVLNHDFGLLFSFNRDYITKKILHRLLFINGIILIILIFNSIFFISIIKKKDTQIAKEQSANNFLKEIINFLPIGIFILDSNRKVILYNEAARDLLLIKKTDELIGKDISDKFLISNVYFNKEKTNSAYDTNQFILYQKQGDEVIIFKKEIPHFINDEEIFLSAFIDVTPIEKARKYEEASNTSKSEFLAKMSHEIRTPMNGIIGMTEALNQKNLTKEQIGYINIIKKSADLLLAIIDDILDFSKIEAGKMQLEEIPYKLREEINICLDLFRPIIEDKELNLESKIPDEIPDNIIGDPFRLRQILSNLISNAVKFTSEGKIVVGVELEEEYSGNISLLVFVEDTGVGIPKEKCDNIFSSFTQADKSTSRKYGGSGLGTAIAKQLVNLMNGEIWVESPSSISTNPQYPGTKFAFTFEVFSNERIKKELSFSHITDFKQVNTLIITRDKSTKSRLYGFLDHMKINIDTFDYKDYALKDLISKLKTNIDHYQLVFILDEPGFDGQKVAIELKNENLTKDYIFIMISSNHKIDNYIETKLAGIDYYYIQPFEQNMIKEALVDIFPNLNIIINQDVQKIRPNISILVAEDNIINQKVAETIFTNLGLSVTIVNDGNEAIESLKKDKYDIIFMDLFMPEKDGIEATVDIRSMGYQIPIIAMTATASKSSKTSAINSGMNDYITKPVKMDTIKKILLKWLSA